MSFVTPPLYFTERETYRCTWCGQGINIGDRFWRWDISEDDGFVHTMHSECYAKCLCAPNLEDGYSPYTNERPPTDA
jgi:hypothetical protein